MRNPASSRRNQRRVRVDGDGGVLSGFDDEFDDRLVFGWVLLDRDQCVDALAAEQLVTSDLDGIMELSLTEAG